MVKKRTIPTSENNEDQIGDHDVVDSNPYLANPLLKQTLLI